MRRAIFSLSRRLFVDTLLRLLLRLSRPCPQFSASFAGFARHYGRAHGSGKFIALSVGTDSDIPT